ncbi:hypothetical protein GCM10009639_41040 [Kitasatospora putterlickiae]|uniref:Uncharacterized protein n=1 Tax=Kitasatospora putterlickiae TaxID=221725 RepID=A0ABN1YCQ3_9ACTN
MDPAWDHAHTTAASARPVPGGLADTDADWRRRLEQTPNGHLLRDNAMLRSLASGTPVHLLHLTRSLDAIRSSGQLLASTGCLVGAVYGSPLTPEPGGALRPHNLGAHLLASRDTLDSRRGSTPLVIEIAPDGPKPAAGLDYLRLGPVHLRTYEAHRHALTPAEHEHVMGSVTDRVHVAAPFLDTLLHNACGRPSPDRPFVDALAVAILAVPYLGYLYFETVAEYLMLYSTGPATKKLAARGEMNNHLYKDLAFSAASGMDTLFDLGRFHPGHGRLLDLLGRIEPALAPGAAAYVRRRLSHTFAATCLAPGQDATTATFRQADPNKLATMAPGLLGQLLFREVRLLDRYPQLYHVFERAKAMEAWAYWNARGIVTPFNDTCGPKGEVGLNPAVPRARVTVWTAATCERGLLHPLEQVDAAPAPRLVPWLVAGQRPKVFGRGPGPTGIRTNNPILPSGHPNLPVLS